MKYLQLITLSLLLFGCSAIRRESEYPHEPCIDAEILCLDAGLARKYDTYTPTDPKEENRTVWWFEVEFEIRAPKEYQGQKIVFPIEPGSSDAIVAQKIYKIRLPVSVIQGRPNASGYYFKTLERP